MSTNYLSKSEVKENYVLKSEFNVVNELLDITEVNYNEETSPEQDTE